MLEPFPRCHHCPVVFEYVLQFADDDEYEVEGKCMWSKEDYARLSSSISAVDWLFEFDGRSINDLCILQQFPWHWWIDLSQSAVELLFLLVWIKSLPRYYSARDKAARWKVYKEVKSFVEILNLPGQH